MNGIIDRKSLSKFLQNHSKAVSKSELQNLFSNFDRDKDQQLNSDEMLDIFLPKTNPLLCE